MSSVNVQRRMWCEQDHTNVSVERSMSSDRQPTKPDVHWNSVDRMVLPADDWQQNAGAVAETGTQWAARYWEAVPFRRDHAEFVQCCVINLEHSYTISNKTSG